MKLKLKIKKIVSRLNAIFALQEFLIQLRHNRLDD